jgi:PAS domain S-box-containing protein
MTTILSNLFNISICASNLIYLASAIIILIIILYAIISDKNSNSKINVNYHLFNNINNIPFPIFIINSNNNKIHAVNDILSHELSRNVCLNIKVADCNVFNNYFDFLKIKQTANYGIKQTKHIELITNNGKKEYDSFYFKIKDKDVEFIVIILSNNINYVKTLEENYILKRILEESPDGIIITQINENKNKPIITYINDATTTITGYSKDDLMGKSINAMFDLNVPEDISNEIERSIIKSETISLDYQYINKKGEIKWIQSTIIPITTENISEVIKPEIKQTQESYIIIHQTDITDHKNAEKHKEIYIEKLNYELAEKLKFSNIAVDSIIDILLNCNGDKRNMCINQMLKNIGKYTNADRAYIFTMYLKDNKPYMKYSFEWVNIDINEQKNNKELSDICLLDIGCHDIYADLTLGKVVNITIDQMPNTEGKRLLKKQNIVNMTLCPIIKNYDLIGYIGIDNCSANKKIDETTGNILLQITKALKYVI